MSATPTSAAEVLAPVVADLLGSTPSVSVRLWDGSELASSAARARVVVRTPRALSRLLFAPLELGLARAYVAGEADVEGDLFALFELAGRMSRLKDRRSRAERARLRARVLAAARRLGVVGRPPPLPPEEARLSGRLHSRRRDRAAISHHYDVGNEFYSLFLGETMTYSCAYFERPDMTLDEAQSAKYELICRKLGLGEGMRFLDVGCGWGGMVLHAATRHGVEAVGVTLSREQLDFAAKRAAALGVADRVEFRLQDYRDVVDGPYDAISSIGMYEHVGAAMMPTYFAKLHSLLRPGGRVVNHGITRPRGSSGFDRSSFIARYVFPDGELHEVGQVVSWMQQQGLEVRDVHSLREHYARTLRAWVSGLEANWERAVELVGERRARVWRLYMAGSAAGFEANRISVHQVLAVRPHPDGRSDMPPTRHSYA